MLALIVFALVGSAVARPQQLLPPVFRTSVPGAPATFVGPIQKTAFAPVASFAPVSSFAPSAPVSSFSPVAPVAPFRPFINDAPFAPVAPVARFSSFTPSAPVSSFSPVAPVAPFKTFINDAPAFAPVGSSFARPAITTVQRTFQADDQGQFLSSITDSAGTNFQEVGRFAPTNDGTDKVLVKSGSFSYTSPEGTPVSVSYTADALGYHPISSSIPVAPQPI